jgi:hypothetical protein
VTEQHVSLAKPGQAPAVEQHLRPALGVDEQARDRIGRELRELGPVVLGVDRVSKFFTSVHEFNPCQQGGIVACLHEHGTD